MKKVLAVAFAIVQAVETAASPQGAGFGQVLSSGNAWRYSPATFFKAHGREGFRALTAKKDSFTCQRFGGVSFAGRKSYETKVWFSSGDDYGRLSRVEISLFNRGDSKSAMPANELEGMLSDVREEIGSGKNAKWGPVDRREKNGFYEYSQLYEARNSRGELGWAVSKHSKGAPSEVGYVRVSLTPPSGKKTLSLPVRKSGSPAALSKIAANVVRRANGDVLIDNVPMVDQGQKGYCAVATAERVLRYYGINVDEHALAQMAGTSATMGTSTGAMVETVRKIGISQRLAKNEIYMTRITGSSFSKLLSDYDKLAKKAGKEPLGPRFRNGDYRGFLSEADPAVYRTLRMKDSGSFSKFMSGIKRQIGLGIPLFWGVVLGIVPEEGLPQANGGHMRLVIGYNEKTGEILYSDSWGMGHEEKRMKAADAWTITNNLFFLRSLVR